LHTFDEFEMSQRCQQDSTLGASVASTPPEFRKMFKLLVDQNKCFTVKSFCQDYRMTSLISPVLAEFAIYAAGIGGDVPRDVDNNPDLAFAEMSPAARQANKLISEFVHFIIESVDASVMKDAIRGAFADNGVGTNSVTCGSLRISHFDCAIDSEPSEAYSTCHDIFGRSPGLSKSRMTSAMNFFMQYQDPNMDVFLLGDSGQMRVRKHIHASLKKQFPLHKVNFVELIPRQADQEVRKRHHWRHRGVPAVKQKIVGLSSTTGREGFYMCHKVGLVARPRKFLPCTVFTSSVAPVMIVPLRDPDDLGPRVTNWEKRSILGVEARGDVIQDQHPTKPPADVDMQSQTWLFTFDKHPVVYQELWWMLYACRVLDFTPGNGSLALQCIRFRIPVVLIVKNALHRDMIKASLVERLLAHMGDPMDVRFYDAAYAPSTPWKSIKGDVPEQPSEPKAKRSRSDK
jgi:hypothetical protein